ncbi:MAG: ABC transporter ATP-binding protein [Verrucomicrobiota bacterium]
MSNTVIRVENLSKLYRLGEVGTGSIAHDVNRWWHLVRGKEDPYLKIGQVNDRTRSAKAEAGNLKAEKGSAESSILNPESSIPNPSPSSLKSQVSSLSSDYVYALKDVSFDVQQGEVLGIIGRNGAGKSTLLKILSRVTVQTTGRIRVKGRIASLLEVGTGFHPELTGRENIFLNGAILGMRKAEIKAKFDEIVDFSGCERYIDTPVKRYSSGMYVRLAFAVAAHLEPEILIVDEVLAVGDAEFQKKCIGKMKDVAGQGRTVLFVSHNMTAVQSLCQKALLLAHGRLADSGSARDMIVGYLKQAQGTSEGQQWTEPDAAPGNHIIRIKRVSILPDDDTPGNILSMQTPLRIETDFWVIQGGERTHLTYHLLNDQGITVLTSGCAAAVREPGLYRASFGIPASLLNSGGYFLKLLIVENENQVTYENEGIAAFEVQDTAERKQAYMGREPGVVQPPLKWITTPVDTTKDACVL